MPRACLLAAVLLGGRCVEAERLLDYGELQGHQGGNSSRAKLAEAHLAEVPGAYCQDPARYRSQCAQWAHLCPGSGASQPASFDEFMRQWCPATCGVCRSDAEAPGSAGALEEGGEDEGEDPPGEESSGRRACTSTMISRRRHHLGADTCACRRRAGNSGLPFGWACNPATDRIEGEAVEDFSVAPACCCKRGSCSSEALRRADVWPHADEDGTLWCCKLKARGASGGCPWSSGYKVEQGAERCERASVPATADACRDRLVDWMRDEFWYKLVEGWEFYPDMYEAYVPCMATEDVHVNTVLLGRRSAVAPLAADNPVRAFVLRQPECAGLPLGQLRWAARAAHQKVCPFAMPVGGYKPEFQPMGTCFYDRRDKTIQQHESKMCPEGHRCACPVQSVVDEAVSAATKGYSTYRAYSIIVQFPGRFAAGSVLAAGVINFPTLATVGGSVAAALGPFALPAAGAVGGLGLVTWGSSTVWRWARDMCDRHVACWPMDCVEEPEGCRIRAPEELADERNPFWYLPPPTYKCAYRRGYCTLSQCSKRNLWNQTVGIRNTTSMWKDGSKTQVYNCQPMVSTDMPDYQRARLAELTHDLKAEYVTKLRIMQRLRQQLEETCPWSRAASDNVVRCRDLTSCRAEPLRQTCCDARGGILQCPENFPLLCGDGYCSDFEELCQGRGGVRECPGAEECPWLLPAPSSRTYACKDGSFARRSMFGHPCQGGGEGGILRCPLDTPVMCANKRCGGDYCCVKKGADCAKKDMGGIRECGVHISDLYNESWLFNQEFRQLG